MSIDKRLDRVYRRKRINTIITIIGFTFAIPLIIMEFGLRLFGMFPMAVASESMSGTLEVGDVIIVENYNHDYSVNLRDIVVYEKPYKNGTIKIIHRVVGTTDTGYSKYYKTKGDNNEEKDPFDVQDEEIVGIVKKRIRFIGYPTVWVYKLIDSFRVY